MTWKTMTPYERLSFIREAKAEGLMLMEVANQLQVTRSIVSQFAKRHGITWVPGGRDGNQNAAIHGHGRNTIMRLAKRVLKAESRDLFLCERCQDHSITIAWPIHHKDRNRNNNDPTNLEVLCNTCHAKEHLNDLPRSIEGQFQANSDRWGGEGG